MIKSLDDEKKLKTLQTFCLKNSELNSEDSHDDEHDSSDEEEHDSSDEHSAKKFDEEHDSSDDEHDESFDEEHDSSDEEEHDSSDEHSAKKFDEEHNSSDDEHGESFDEEHDSSDDEHAAKKFDEEHDSSDDEHDESFDEEHDSSDEEEHDSSDEHAAKKFDEEHDSSDDEHDESFDEEHDSSEESDDSDEYHPEQFVVKKLVQEKCELCDGLKESECKSALLNAVFSMEDESRLYFEQIVLKESCEDMTGKDCLAHLDELIAERDDEELTTDLQDACSKGLFNLKAAKLETIGATSSSFEISLTVISLMAFVVVGVAYMKQHNAYVPIPSDEIEI